MTTFNLSNYEDKEKASSEDKPPVEGGISQPEKQEPKVIDTVETSEVTLTGSISEIVARSLYGIFPNTQTISQETHGDIIRMTVPKLSVTNVAIVTLAREDIVNNPVISLRAANRIGALVYIDMQGHSALTNEEEWFYLNLANEQYYSISAITERVAALCLA